MKYMDKIGIYHLPVLIAAVFLIVLCALCSGCYTLKQGTTMIGYLNKAIPLERLDDAEFTSLIADIRRFATEYLGLSENRNYTTYVEIDRSYLAAVVSAAAKDSFSRHEWSFPVVGRVPYKGFFNIEDARKEQDKLEKKDLDVWISRVDAFSTLGWFKDPLYSFMRDYTPSRLAEVIIHELVHATVFIKGQAKFNEELAEFIGVKAGKLFIETRYGIDSDEYREMINSTSDSQKFVEFIQELIAELDTMYAGDLAKNKKLIEKERIINAAKTRFNAEYDSSFSNDNYRGFSQMQINNAYLELFRLYYTDDNFYEDLFERSGGDLRAFIAAAKTITAKGDTPRAQLDKALII